MREVEDRFGLPPRRRERKLPNEYLSELGHRLRLLRVALRFDQKQMSQALDTAQSQISKIEAGNAGPMLYQLLRLKSVIEEDEYLRESVSWGWVLEGKGKGIL